MTNTIIFSWPEKQIRRTVSVLDFRYNYAHLIGDCPFFSGEFDPPLEMTNRAKTEIDKIHFSNISFTRGDLILKFCDKATIINYKRSSEPLKFKVIGPEVFNVPKPLNRNLSRVRPDCCAHLFFKDNIYDDLASPSYFASISGPWNTFYSLIKAALINSNYGKYGIRCKVLHHSSPENQTFNRATEIFQFGSPLKTLGKLVVCIIVNSSNELAFSYHDNIYTTEIIPKVPKSFIYRCADLMAVSAGSDIEIICRRVIVSCLNGAIPLQILNLLGNLINDQNLWNFSAEDFERVCIKLTQIDMTETGVLENQFERPISNLKRNLLNDSPEADFRYYFWDYVIDQLFYDKIKSLEGGFSRYRTCPEWETRNLFPDLEKRKVDIVLLVEYLSFKFPGLIIEISKDSFGFGTDSHKDFSKLIGTMSLSCKKLVRELERIGKRAEDARIFGAWIGSLQIQFCVVHPVITRLEGEENLYSIHTHVTFPPEWKFDMLSDPAIEDQQFTAYSSFVSSTVAPNLFDSLLSGNPDLITDYEPRTDLQSRDEEDAVPVDDKSTAVVTAQRTPPPAQEAVQLFQGRFNPTVIIRIKQFFEIAINRFEYIYASPVTLRVTVREFSEEGKGLIVSARPSSLQQTPAGEQIQERGVRRAAEEEHPESPSERAASGRGRRRDAAYSHLQVKKSAKEFLIIKNKIIDYPQFFGKYFKAKQDKKDPSKFVYEHEYMTPMVNNYGEKSGQMEYCSIDEGLDLALKFAFETLNCLQILHETFNLVHSDLSPANVLYSHEDKCWKIIDFDHAYPLKESLITKRTAGTPNYIAPESLASGIFDKASDIWSLGRILFNIFLLPLFPAMESSRVSDLTKEDFRDLQRIVVQMCATDVKVRPTATEALRRVFNIVKRYDGLYDDSHVVYQRARFICTKLRDPKPMRENPESKLKNLTEENDNKNMQIAV